MQQFQVEAFSWNPPINQLTGEEGQISINQLVFEGQTSAEEIR